jgi:hypothetical protein
MMSANSATQDATAVRQAPASGGQGHATREGSTPLAMGYHGGLAARYESGSRGSEAIGYDGTGGHSYGAYQIATNTGTMRRFMSYLQQNHSDIHQRLQAAGGEPAARAGSPQFRAAWLELARNGSLRAAEQGFISATHYEPLARKVQSENNIDLASRSQALREVIWSTAVQHGGGTNVVTRALERLGARDGSQLTDQQIIEVIYQERGTRFGSSTAAIQASAQRRFQDERQRAQTALAQELQSPDGGRELLQQGTQMAAADQAQARNGGQIIQMPAAGAGSAGSQAPPPQQQRRMQNGEVPLNRRLEQQVS